MKPSSSAARAWAALCVSAALVGCGEEAGPVLAPVTGTVTLGGQPADGVAVSFVPDGATKGTGGTGVSDAEGRFTLTHRDGRPGVEPGTYKVLLSRMRLPGGGPIPPDMTAADSGAVETVPAAYSDPERTRLREDVPPDGKAVTIDVRTR